MQLKHYNGRTYTRRPIADRLAARLIRLPSGCLVWTGSTTDKGYGQIGRGDGEKGLALTHRVAYEVHIGPIPAGLLVLHSCDNPPCCEPTHLFVGTHADNVADMDAKGRRRNRPLYGADHWTRKRPDRIPRGAAHSQAKMTDQQVAEVRRRYAAGGILQRELAAEFGVSQIQISRVVRGVTYAAQT